MSEFLGINFFKSWLLTVSKLRVNILDINYLVTQAEDANHVKSRENDIVRDHTNIRLTEAYGYGENSRQRRIVR